MKQNAKVNLTELAQINEQSLTMIAFTELFNIVSSMFTWKGLPSDIPVDYMEKSLLMNGTVGIIQNPATKEIMLSTGTATGLNHYGLPTKFQPTSPTFNEVYGAKQYTLGVDSVLVRSGSSFMYGSANTFPNLGAENLTGFLNGGMDLRVMFNYASLMAKARVLQMNNVNALAQPIIITVDARNEASFKTIFNKVMHNEPAIFAPKMNKSETIDDFIKLLDLNPQFYIDKLEDYYVSIRNTALTYFGINNFNSDKSERLISSEVNANNMQIQLALENQLQTRRQAAEQANKLFGTNISVDATYKETEHEHVHSYVSRTVRDGREREEADF